MNSAVMIAQHRSNDVGLVPHQQEHFRSVEIIIMLDGLLSKFYRKKSNEVTKTR